MFVKVDEHVLETPLDLSSSGNTRRVNIVNTRADRVRVSVVLESIDELHVALRCFDGDDICVKTLDLRKDVVEVGVAEVRVSLSVITNTSSRQLEGVSGPLQG